MLRVWESTSSITLPRPRRARAGLRFHHLSGVQSKPLRATHLGQPAETQQPRATNSGRFTLSRFEENIGALEVTLEADDFDRIEAANIPIQGARYPDHQLRRVGP